MTRGRTKVVDLEITRPLGRLEGLAGYASVLGLVRVEGRPVGYVRLPVHGDACPAEIVRREIHANLAEAIVLDGLRQASVGPCADADLPGLTAVVCTRDRAALLGRCLDSLSSLDYPGLEVLVVDNAPSNDETRDLVLGSYPDMRYVREPTPGLDVARNRAIAEARTEIVAFTDDDVVLDPQWARAFGEVFSGDHEVQAITGLVVPWELETEAQRLFEDYGGFGCGFRRRWFQADPAAPNSLLPRFGAAGQFGTGANMAFRRSLFERIGPFDPALDVGTVTNGGGDIEMFFRVLKEGHLLVYEPRALARHRHRRDYRALSTQIANNGVGFTAYLVRTAQHYPALRPAVRRFWVSWLWRWHIRRIVRSLLGGESFPRELILAELVGYLRGLRRYQKSRRILAGAPAETLSGAV